MQNLFLFTNVKDGTLLPQVIPGGTGTRPKAGGAHEFIFFEMKSSSRSNPATRCPRTCLTQNSTTRPSAERSLHHCSFRSEKNQRTEDKLITLLKKVCCQLSPCLSVMQERGTRARTQFAKFKQQRKTKSRLRK